MIYSYFKLKKYIHTKIKRKIIIKISKTLTQKINELPKNVYLAGRNRIESRPCKILVDDSSWIVTYH